MRMTFTFLVNLLALLFAYHHNGYAAPKIDPIKFELSTNASHIIPNEEFEIKITAKYISLNPNLVYVFKGSNSFNLKLILPDGFRQTGGDFHDFAGAELTSEKPSITYTIKGKFTENNKGGDFQLLRSHQEANNRSEFIQVGMLSFSVITPNSTADSLSGEALRLALAPKYIPYMTQADFRTGLADSSEIVYINEGLKSGIFQFKTGDTSTADDSSMVLVHGGRRYFRENLGYIRPEWFGANSQDATDDYEWIQKTFNYVRAKGGGSVHLSPGIYMSSKPLFLKSSGTPHYYYNITVEGSGKAVTKIRGTETFTGNLLNAIEGETSYDIGRENNITIKDISFEARGAAQCLNMNFLAGVYLLNCQFMGGEDYCVQLGGNQPTRNYSTYIKDCYFSGSAKNSGMNNGTLLLKYGFFIDIDRMESDGGGYGIKMDNCVSTVITNSKIEGCKKAVIHSTGNGWGQHRITGNYLFAYGLTDINGAFDGTAYGIFIESDTLGSNANSVIANNVITVSNSASWPTNMTYTAKSSSLASGEVISSSGATGILQAIIPTSPTTGRLVIKVNTGTFAAGQTISQASTGGTATIGTVTTTTTYGIKAQGMNGSNGSNTFSNNIVSGSTTYGMHLTSPSNIVVSNVISGETGIYINTSGSIIGNKFWCQNGLAINNDGVVKANLLSNRVDAGAKISGVPNPNHLMEPLSVVDSIHITTNNKAVMRIKRLGLNIMGLSNFGVENVSLVGLNGATIWLGNTGGNTSSDLNAQNIGVTPTGKIIMKTLPTSTTNLTSGMIWRDAAAGNVIKIVP